jgi:glycosyltransferase involved in cell wall biosynthesis
MTDLPSVFFSPLTRLLRIPHVLWYAHSNYSIYLKISSLFVNRILTSTPGSCPYRGKKLSVVGQMVDETLFLPNRTRESFQFLKILHVGRLDPSKNIKEVILTFLELFGQYDSATLSFIGTFTYGNERYLIDLKKEFSDEIGQGKIMLLGKLGRDEVVQRMNSSDLLLHAYQGSLDKVLVEAVLLELPVVSTNLEFNRIFGFGLEKAGKVSKASLSEKCKVLLETPKAELVNIAKSRREVALQGHSLTSWITRVLRELESF